MFSLTTEALATLIERIIRGIERVGHNWTPARRKEGIQRVLAGGRGDAKKLQQRLSQLVTSWESDAPGIELQRDPLGSDALADLLGTTPGVARTLTAEGTGLSIAGQPADQTRYTVDGGEGAPGMVPREALRDVEVRTSPFDVSRGRFTGGQVELRTQGAGNACRFGRVGVGERPADAGADAGDREQAG